MKTNQVQLFVLVQRPNQEIEECSSFETSILGVYQSEEKALAAKERMIESAMQNYAEDLQRCNPATSRLARATARFNSIKAERDAFHTTLHIETKEMDVDDF